MSNCVAFDLDTVDLKNLIDESLLVTSILEWKYPYFLSENLKKPFDNSLDLFQYLHGDVGGQGLYDNRFRLLHDIEYKFICNHTNRMFYVCNTKSDNSFVIRESNGAFGFSFDIIEQQLHAKSGFSYPRITVVTTTIDNEPEFLDYLKTLYSKNGDQHNILSDDTWELLDRAGDTLTSDLKLIGDIWEPALNDDTNQVAKLIERSSFAANAANYYEKFFVHAQSGIEYDNTHYALTTHYGIKRPEIHAFHRDELENNGGYKPLICGATDVKFVIRKDVVSGVYELNQADGKFGCTFMLTAPNGLPYAEVNYGDTSAYVKVIRAHGLKDFKQYFTIAKLSVPAPSSHTPRQKELDRIWLQHPEDMRDRPNDYDPDEVDLTWFNNFVKENVD
ncbi:hypothetical protein ACTOV4_02720 [Brucella sp. C7-11G]